MKNPNAPIGVYDSGVGGLTVWKALHKLLPSEQFIYFGDTLNLPYGEKSRAEIIEYSQAIVDFFAELHVKAVVAACNTSSALAVPVIAPRYSFPIFEVISPAVRTSIALSANKRIGVFATEGTVRSGVYQRSILQHPKAYCLAISCPRLVPLIEEGIWQGEVVEQAVQAYLEPLLAKDIDTLILGCTHYPVIRGLIQQLAPSLNIVDPAWQTANDTLQYLDSHGLTASRQPGPNQFWVSGNVLDFSARAENFLQHPLGIVNKWKAEPRTSLALPEESGLEGN